MSEASEESNKSLNSSSMPFIDTKCDLDETVCTTDSQRLTSFNERLCKNIDLGMNMDSKKLFVGGLSWETTENLMKEYFSQFGAVRTCTIKVDKATGHSRGFGFVIFDSETDLDAVLSQPEHWLCNKRIDPKRAKPSRQEPARKVFVGGLDPEFPEDAIKEYFRQFGKILAIDLPIDSLRHRRKAFIFVTYASEAEAKKAAQTEKQLIGAKWCDVRIVQRREQQLARNRQQAAVWWQHQQHQPEHQLQYQHQTPPSLPQFEEYYSSYNNAEHSGESFVGRDALCGYSAALTGQTQDASAALPPPPPPPPPPPVPQQQQQPQPENVCDDAGPSLGKYPRNLQRRPAWHPYGRGTPAK